MSRLLRRNRPCRRTVGTQRSPCCVCSSNSEDDHDERLDQLRRALHHFTLGVEIPSDSDESEEEDTLGVDTPSESDESEEEDHPDEEDDLGDPGDPGDPRLGQLRKALALAQHYTSEDDESESESGQGENEAPP